MSKTVMSIGCRLPTGLVIEIEGANRVTLEGQRQTQKGSKLILLSEDDYGVTQVDTDFWEAWKKHVGPNYAPLKSGAIFEAVDEKSARSVARELAKKKTGHEPVKQDAPGIKDAAKDD